jgi:hypothetical protein
MSALRVMAKLFTLSLGIISLVAVAETYYDQKFYTADFMDEVQEVELRMPAASEKRIVASFTKKLPEVMPVSNAQKMKRAIDGNWQITRVIDDNDNIVYDYANRVEDQEEKVIGNFQYNVRTNSVRINGEIDQTYKISLMTVQGTIALFKEFGEGYEVVEARKVKEQKKVEEVEEVKPQVISKFSVSEDLSIISALDPKKNRNVLRGDSITGSAYLKDGLLTLDGVQLHIGSKHQTETLSISDVNVAKHGTFNDDEGTQGIITNIGNDEVKIRFSTGPLAGVMLNFVTDEKRSEIEQKFGVPSAQAPELPGEEVQQAQAAPAKDKVESYDQAQSNDGQDSEDEEYEEDQDQYEDEYKEEYEDEEQGSRESDRYEDEARYQDEGLIEDIDEARSNAVNDLDREPASTDVKEVGFSF